MSATPAVARKDRKRGEIVAIARDMFFRDGYAHTSMSQIAATLGGSKGTLYAYFRSKEELLLAVVQDVVTPRPDDYDWSAMPKEFRAWLVWFGVASMKRITTYNYISLQRLAAGEALRFPEIGRTFYEAIAPSYQMAAEFFKAAMDRGVLRRADPRAAVERFLELCAGWLLRRVIWNIEPPPSDAQWQQAAREAAGIFMDGYAAAPKQRQAKRKAPQSRPRR